MRIAASILALFFGASSVAGADTGESIVRHTSFAITVGSSETAEAGGSGVGLNVFHNTSTLGGSSRGTITLDVLASSDKGGLLLIVAEDAGTQKGAPTRIIVGKSGLLYYRSQVNEEERQIARLFARNLIPVEHVSVGFRWKLESSEESVDYRVVRIIDDNSIEIAFDGSVKVGSPSDHAVRVGTFQGRIIYDVTRSIPKRLEFHMRSRGTGDTMTTANFDTVAELKEDIFPAASPLPSVSLS